MMMRRHLLVLSISAAIGCSEESTQNAAAPQAQTIAPKKVVHPALTNPADEVEEYLDDPHVAEVVAELMRMQASVSKETGGRFLWDKQERRFNDKPCARHKSLRCKENENVVKSF